MRLVSTPHTLETDCPHTLEIVPIPRRLDLGVMEVAKTLQWLEKTIGRLRQALP